MKSRRLCTHLFGQPPLPPDPELQSVNSQIEDLKEQRGRLYEFFKHPEPLVLAP